MKICFIPHSSPDFLGGVNLFHRNLINYIKTKRKNIDLTSIYFGEKNEEYEKKGVNYVEIKHSRAGLLSSYLEKLKFPKILVKYDFDVVNCGSGIWAWLYKKPKKQRLVHTFHGSVFYFNKNHLKRFGFFTRILLSPWLLISYLHEMPTKKADKLICVSEKVKRQIESLYGKKDNIIVIRTGVNLKIFKKRDKKLVRRKLNFNSNNLIGLYVGKGGYWTKGLDRVINLSEEIYKKNKNYELVLIGPDKKKVWHLIDKPFVRFKENINREEMPLYYNASDIFFCLSRYEGGAPTLVVSEAMASGCFLVCSKDSEQEIVSDGKNALVIESFRIKSAEKIMKIYNNKNLREEIIGNSLKTIKDFSLEKWGGEYMNVLFS